MNYLKHIATVIPLSAIMLNSYAGTIASADLDKDGVPTTISQIGKIPTINYSIPAEQMLSLIKQDIDEKRVHFSVTKPSHLDSYIESTENIPNGIKPANGSFAANSTGKICVTIVYLNVSSSSSTSGTQGGLTQSVVRNCAPTDGLTYGYSQWARSTIGVATTNGTGLQNLYNAVGVTNRYNPNGVNSSTGFRGEAFSSTSFGVATEYWGTTFFNTYGVSGAAQDIVLVVASWV